MGDWNLQVAGVGPHHNGDETDVDQVAKTLVRELREAGHTVTLAHVDTLDRGRTEVLAQVDAEDAGDEPTSDDDTPEVEEG
jgi:hypothetical protein